MIIQHADLPAAQPWSVGSFPDHAKHLTGLDGLMPASRAEGDWKLPE